MNTFSSVLYPYNNTVFGICAYNISDTDTKEWIAVVIMEAQNVVVAAEKIQSEKRWTVVVVVDLDKACHVLDVHLFVSTLEGAIAERGLSYHRRGS